jgi:hypothetical protein
MNERRTAIRIKVDVAARYRRDGEFSERVARIDNISRNGLLLVAEEAVPEGTQLRISFSGQDGAPHAIVGEVVRAAPMGAMGVSFVHVEEATLRYVREALGVP